MPRSRYLYLNSTITSSITMPLSMSQCHNHCHTVSILVTLYQPVHSSRNNHPSISFGCSTFKSYTFPKHWTFQEMSHMPQHNHGLCQDNNYDLCQDHHTICLDNHHDLYKQITNIYDMININCAPTYIPISPSSIPRDKNTNMYKIHTFSVQQDGP